MGYIQEPLLMTVQYTRLYCRRFQALLRMTQKRCQRFSLHSLLSYAASVKRKYQKEKLCIRRRNHPNCSAHCRVFLKATHASTLSSSSATTAFSKSSKSFILQSTSWKSFWLCLSVLVLDTLIQTYKCNQHIVSAGVFIPLYCAFDSVYNVLKVDSVSLFFLPAQSDNAATQHDPGAGGWFGNDEGIVQWCLPVFCQLQEKHCCSQSSSSDRLQVMRRNWQCKLKKKSFLFALDGD